MKITVLTVCPEAFDGFLSMPVPARAVRKGAAEIEIVDIREYAPGSFRHIDDSPYGGGAGMVMRCQPVLDALQDKSTPGCVSVAMTPAGQTYTQETAHEFAEEDHIILVCGHYEGMDERIYGHIDRQVSIGDYILTGGETASIVIMDSIVRLLPDVLRGASTKEESFEDGLLEYPQYTQPSDYNGEKVPEVLLSGNHERIRKWRLKESLRRTLERRPDLLTDRTLTKEENKLLEEIKSENEIRDKV